MPQFTFPFSPGNFSSPKPPASSGNHGAASNNHSSGKTRLRNAYLNDPTDSYQQQLDAVQQQPKPANLTPYSTLPQYQQALAQMRQAYAQLGGQSQQMAALLNSGLGAEQRRAIMEMLQPQQRQNQAVFLYGY